VIMNGE